MSEDHGSIVVAPREDGNLTPEAVEAAFQRAGKSADWIEGFLASYVPLVRPGDNTALVVYASGDVQLSFGRLLEGHYRVCAHQAAWDRFDDYDHDEACERTLAALKALLAFTPTSLDDVREIAAHLLEYERDGEPPAHIERAEQCGLVKPWLRVLAGLPEADAAEPPAAAA